MLGFMRKLSSMLAALPMGPRNQNVDVAHPQISSSQRANLERCPGLPSWGPSQTNPRLL